MECGLDQGTSFQSREFHKRDGMALPTLGYNKTMASDLLLFVSLDGSPWGDPAVMLCSCHGERPTVWGTEVCQQSCGWTWKPDSFPLPKHLHDGAFRWGWALIAWLLLQEGLWTRGTQLGCPWTLIFQNTAQQTSVSATELWSNLLCSYK